MSVYCAKDLDMQLIPNERIQARLTDMAADITRDYAGKNPIVIGILKGAVVFLSDLIRKINCPLQLDFMAVSSYGMKSCSCGDVNIKKDTDLNIQNRHVLIVEDIIDTGLTMNALINRLKLKGPLSIGLACLIDKPARRACGVNADYVGFVIPDGFVVGYGLDYAENYRNLPYIGVLKPDVYSK